MDIAQQLKFAIAHRIACIDKTYINGFAGTSRSRKRHSGDIHALAREIMKRTFDPFDFRWDFGNREPAEFSDVYLVVFTTLVDIDDEDAARWSSKTEGDAVKNEAARDIARALMRKFVITRRPTVEISPNREPGETGSFDGRPTGAHTLGNTRYEDERNW